MPTFFSHSNYSFLLAPSPAPMAIFFFFFFSLQKLSPVLTSSLLPIHPDAR